jgi:cell division transport system ATP-binding protein
VVRLEHIGKRYGNGPPVLSDVSLELEPGEFAVLTGAGGAGKTTLLNIIGLAELPSQGRLSLFGVATASADRTRLAALRRRIGVVFQDCRLVDRLTVRDNIALPLRIAGTPEPQIDGDVSELLAWLGLAARADVRAATLTRSDRQLTAIARAIVGRPELLLADDPGAGLDDKAAPVLLKVFEQIARIGTTVLIATHDAGFAGQFVHQRYRVEQGKLSAVDAALDHR